MLSIRLNANTEWWVSGKVFERLFQSAVNAGKIPPNLEYWRHVADANGGLDLSKIEPSEADQLADALRHTAEREVAGLGETIPNSENDSYRVSLLKLLEAISEQQVRTRIRSATGT